MSVSRKDPAATPSTQNQQISKSRRRMIKALAWAPILPSVVSSSLIRAQTATVPAVTPGSSPQAEPASLKPSSEAEALAEIVKHRYGKFLNEAQLAEIKLSLERGLSASRRLREFKLKNSDEPATIFAAD